MAGGPGTEEESGRETSQKPPRPRAASQPAARDQAHAHAQTRGAQGPSERHWERGVVFLHTNHAEKPGWGRTSRREARCVTYATGAGTAGWASRRRPLGTSSSDP